MIEDQLCRKYACIILWGDTWEESERLRRFVFEGDEAPINYRRVAGIIKDYGAELMQKESKR